MPTYLKSIMALMLSVAAMMAIVPVLFDDSWIAKLDDPVIRTGVRAAIDLNMIPSADEKVYPGHFYINADGGGYGNDTTWPGLDSWQMAGAYLLLGRTRLVEDYFDFVRASQRKDGNIPFAIFNGDTRAGDTYLRGLKWPDDSFTYKPPTREGLPASSQETRTWVGLFRHWELTSNPLATLGPICYVLTAQEIFASTKDAGWLKEHLESIEATGRYLTSQISPNGLMAGSGFYTELPPRNGWDGVTQCYAVKAFHDLESIEKILHRNSEARAWKEQADKLAKSFRNQYWRTDHFAEYIHVTKGLVDSHGLSDTNWAAIAFGVATRSQTKLLWPKLTSEKAFWPGGMPSLTVTKPFSYEAWEDDPVPFQIPSTTNDVASMGRTWYVEALACLRMGDRKRLVESTRQVCKMAEGGFWRERYHPLPDGSARPDGSQKYCEYPSVLVRIVLGNPNAFAARSD